MISEMSLVEIVGPRETFDLSVETLHTSGLVHVEEIPLVESGTQGLLHRLHLSDAQVREKNSYEELVQLLDEAITHIPTPVLASVRQSPRFQQEYSEWENRPLSSIASAARAHHAKVRSFVRRRRNLGDDLRVLSGYEEVVVALAPLVESHELPRDFEFVGVIFERKNREARNLLERELGRLTADQYRFFQTGVSGGRTAALVGFHKRFAHEARTFIAEAGISEMRAPRYLRDKPFEQALAALEEDLAFMRKEHQALLKEMKDFYAENGPKLLALQCVCRDRFSRLDVTSKFAQTRHAFIIKGWAPGRLLDDLRARLSEACGETVVVREVSPAGASTPPVLLDNPKPVRPFQRLMCLLPLPKYGTIDPTSFLATFFPPIFGLMLGDVGYGLILAIGAGMLCLFNRGRKLQKDLAIILGYCAFWTLLFGFIFGELFGPVGHHIGLNPIWRERFPEDNKAEALLGYLAIAVGVGVLHITWGLVLGIINARKTGNRSRALDCGARI
ncbi:MAG: V-type ATP synthase subunit I, partial [Acidobacteriota bacterium]